MFANSDSASRPSFEQVCHGVAQSNARDRADPPSLPGAAVSRPHVTEEIRNEQLSCLISSNLSRLQFHNEVAKSGSVRPPIERGGALDVGFDYADRRLR